MPKMDRRGFLKLAGAGTAGAAAAAAIPTVEMLFKRRSETVAIRAIGGLPAKPLPSYASYVLDGYVDLNHKSGTLTRTLLAGDPEAMTDIALPGLSRTIKVTDVSQTGNVLQLTGVIVDRSQLSPGESADVVVRIDRSGGVVWAELGTSDVQLKLLS